MEKPALRELLLSYPEVPPHNYVITPEGVFVLAALEHACAQAIRQAPGTPVRRLLMKFLPKAYVSPYDAVHKWGVRPDHFTFASIGGKQGRQVIYHALFDAILACDFSKHEDGTRLMVDILCGKPITPTGHVDFWVDGRPFRWSFTLPTQEELNLPVLPDNAQLSLIAQPEIPPAVKTVIAQEYIQRAIVEQSEVIARVRTSYLDVGSRICPEDWSHITPELLAAVESRVSSVDLPLVTNPLLSKAAQDQVNSIRQVRPELAALSGEMLHHLFMQQELLDKECETRGFHLPSDERVLVLCLGHAARANLPLDFAGSHVLNTGIWVLAFLRHGNSLNHALEHAARCQVWYQKTYWKLNRMMAAIEHVRDIES